MSIKSITIDNKYSCEYEPHEIKDANTARVASIHLLFSHVADFHKLIVKIIAEKYNLNEDDIYSSIIEHPEYKNMTISPIICGLSHINQDDVNKVITPKNEVIVPPVSQKLKIIRKKKIINVTEKIEI